MIDKATRRRINSACGHAMVGVLVLFTVLAGGTAPAQAALQVSNLGQGTATETMLHVGTSKSKGFKPAGIRRATV